MAKLAKRLLIVALAVTVVAAIGIAGFVGASEPAEELHCYTQGDVAQDGTVNKTDAIYLLYASIPMFKEEYPLNQECDFVKDDVIDKKDALYLLFASMFEDDYPLKGVIHNYHDPIWSWTEDNGDAVLTLKCACSQAHEETATVSSSVTKDPTCVAAGVRSITATVVVDGETYTTTKEIAIPATGVHTYSTATDCETGAVCADCGFELKAPGHKWVLDSTTAATCTTQKVEHYECSVCDATKDSAVGDIAGHSYSYVKDIAVEGQECTYVKQYTCTTCHEVFDGLVAADTYVKHDYSDLRITEATCVAEGLKTYYCSNCNTPKPTEDKDVIAINENHAWSDGSTGTISCTRDGCSATKVVATDGKVSTNALTENTSVALDNNVAMTMDQTALNKLEGNREIAITVDTKTATEVGVEGEKLTQIGNNPIYDINLAYTDNGEKVSQFEGGKVTVSLPYELGEGEDVDSIDVWFINDTTGAVEQVFGTYSNGFVTFETDHFSYYTVTRLTTAQRCARYGHIEKINHKDASCTEDGYDEKVCQRCGEVISKTTYPATGHSYTHTTVDATCTQDGSVVSVCGTCNDQVTKVLPAFGHTLEISKNTPATCTDTGVKVSSCANCDYEDTEILPQIDHTYVYSAEESQTVSCTAAGFDTYICTCGAKITKNEKAPLGHDYHEDDVQWIWNEEDISSSTVKLVCRNDTTHTKELPAVVTLNTEESSNVSCLGAGAVVHDAAASFNNVTYTAKHTATVDAPGHQKGTERKANASKHYYECTVCQTPLDAESHTWNDGTVTKEATCAAKGTMLVACTVCAYEKEQSIPATGEHTYVDGVCSGCGLEEDACVHQKVYKTEMDLSGYDFCEGVEIYSYSCACGENAYIALSAPNCVFKEDEEAFEQGKDENGNYYSISIYSCAECGLSRKQEYGSEIDVERCVAVYVVREEIFFDGVSLGMENSFLVGELSHPGITVVKTEKLEGLCGEEITYKQCPCGKYERISVSTKCSWSTDQDFTPDAGYRGGYRENCTVCNAVRTYMWKPVEGDIDCISYELDNTTYTLNGTVLLSYDELYEYENHNYDLGDAEKLGESCTDGILYQIICQSCGYTKTNYSEAHIPANREIIKLDSTDICSDILVQATCLCDVQMKQSYLDSSDGTVCDFRMVESQEAGKTTYVCNTCSASYTKETTYGEKDENCVQIVSEVKTYKDASGNVLGTGYDVFEETNHSQATSCELVAGATNCEDGVVITNYCEDCDWKDVYTTNWHQRFTSRTYDLSAFGGCNSQVSVQVCACGQEAGLFWDENGNDQCSWEYVTGSEFSDTEKCTNCGILKTTSWQNVPVEGTCKVRRITVIELAKEGVETLKFSYTSTYNSHDYFYEFTLTEGATSCQDGYMTEVVCQACGYTSQWGPNTGCYAHLVARETVTGLCSTVTANYYSCACGTSTRVEMNWEGAQCRFSSSQYDPLTGSWTYTCEVCGSTRKDTYTRIPIEGSTCEFIGCETETYLDKDGNELLVADNKWRTSSHEYVHTLHPLGTTCSEGYTVTGTCAKCGDVEENGYVYTECQNWTLKRTVLHDGTGICGPITLRETGCLCGAQVGGGVYDSCNWRYDYDNETGEYYQYCVDCGVRYEGNITQTYAHDTCKTEVKEQYRYYTVGENGETTVAEGTATYQNQEHLMITSYTSQPENCSEGYSIVQSCYFCGYTDSDWGMIYEHRAFTTGVVDLYEYGMCGGFINQSQCACGEELNCGISRELCNWEHQGNTQEGASIYYCGECETYLYRTEDGEYNPETCLFEGTVRHLFVREEETVLEYTTRFAYERHDTQPYATVLNDAEAGCDGGYTLIEKCVNCGKTEEHTGYRGHDLVVPTTAVISDCGTRVYYGTCPCGKYSYVNYDWECLNAETEYTSDGDRRNGTSLWQMRCEDCGLAMTEKRQWTVEEGTCLGIQTGTYTITLGDTVQELSYSNEYYGHEFGDYTYTLKGENTSCEQGVYAHRICALCETVENGYTEGHAYNKQYIDLAEYGAVCGATLVKYSCACGLYNKYDVADSSQCITETKETDLWIENALVDEYQENTDNWQEFNSAAYTITCAVTDPACGLKLRVAEYWLVENCIATEYQQWQYFDAETESWVTIDTVETGLTGTFHTYERKPFETTEGNATVTGWTDTCTACGSSHSYLTYTYEDKSSINKSELLNTLDNGDRKSSCWTCKNVYYSDIEYTVMERYDYTYADGSTYWYQLDRTYDFSDGCKVTIVETNSNGWTNTMPVQDAHREGWQAETLTVQTCTQFGSRLVTEACAMCKTVVNQYIETFEPYAHCWNGPNEDGMYWCGSCGLESESGASGEIVFEDLTDEYGEETNYVVGYWNRSEDAEFTPTLSVVLDEVTEGDNVLDLTFDAFSYLTVENGGVVAVSFNKADAQAAAKAAMETESYTGSYAIRLNFVLVGGGSSADYAITFDSQN